MKIKLLIFSFTFFLFFSCKNENKKESENVTSTEENTEQEPFFKLSLAQWSLNGPIRSGEMNPLDFAQKASQLGFDGIEYVTQLYTPMMEEYGDAAMDSLLPKMKEKSEQYNVRNVLIMVDNEGDLAATAESDRDAAVEKHKKWVDAAAYLGCHSIRVNLFGAEDAETWKESSVDGLSKLSDYAATKNINVLVENHGGFSSNAELLMDVMNTVNKENCGTLPDFGNFCLKREGGARWQAPCVEEYPIYKGVEELMPKAFAVSAKTYNFDEEGEETKIDYTKMMQIVKDAGYTNFVGVEYEGDLPNPEEGIKLTRELLITASQNLK